MAAFDLATPRTPAPSPTDELSSASVEEWANMPGVETNPEVKPEPALETNCSPKSRYKVLIIGAGVAGLAAANHLLQNGCKDFCILEARKRIGGRVASIPLDSHMVEMGANWIHGVLGNPIFEIAVQHGLVGVVNVPKAHKIIAATENGVQVPFDMLHGIYEAYVCFMRRCDEYFLCQYSPPPGINSVGEHINYEIAIYLSSIEDPKEKRLKQAIFNCLLKRETCITGCHNMNEIDLLELGSYTELQGGNIVLPSGYSSVLKPLSAEIPKEAIIKNCPVKKIHWRRKKTIIGLETVDENSECDGDDDTSSTDSQKTVTEVLRTDQLRDTVNDSNSTILSKSNENNLKSNEQASDSTFIEVKKSISDNVKDNDDTNNCSVRVMCENGRLFRADHVICTIPLGVLKNSHQELFDPELPRYKQESIENLMFGTVNKIFLEYDRPFLCSGISEIMLLWDDDKYDVYLNSEEKLSNEYLNKTWYKKIYSFAKITDTLLLGWVSGKEAEYMETLPPNEVADKCTEILRCFLQDPCIPKPKRCICTSWKSQTYTKGSYTSIPVGALQEDIENLAQPVYANPQSPKPAITFAGEHTHSSFYSTVHGAYLSGRTAAQCLLSQEEPGEIVLESDSSDMSAWIQGIALD